MSSSDKPIVIEEPGDYAARDGSRITIRSLDGRGTFNVRGQIWRQFRGAVRPRGYDIWAPDGRYRAFGESDKDVIGHWPEGDPDLTP